SWGARRAGGQTRTRTSRPQVSLRGRSAQEPSSVESLSPPGSTAPAAATPGLLGAAALSVPADRLVRARPGLLTRGVHHPHSVLTVTVRHPGGGRGIGGLARLGTPLRWTAGAPDVVPRPPALAAARTPWPHPSAAPGPA